MNYSTCVDFKICLRTGKVNRLLEKRAPPPKYFIFFVDNKKLTLLYNSFLAISSDLENLKLKKKKSIKRFSFRFHDNSDVIVTSIITNFHLYLLQLWCSFLQIFVDGDVVNAQTWEILPLKNPIEPPYGLDTFVQTKGGTHKTYLIQLKHQVPIMYQ